MFLVDFTEPQGPDDTRDEGTGWLLVVYCLT
jgi:hypothetical protein